jgi:hypothetical protein
LRHASCKRRCRLIEHGDAPVSIGRIDGGWQSIDDLAKASLTLADLGRSEKRLVGHRGEGSQVTQHAHVFGTKLATMIVIDHPNRAHRLPIHMKREEQPLLEVGLYFREAGEEALGVGKQQGNVAIEDRAAGTKVSGCACAQVTSPLPSDSRPISIAPA